MKPLRFLLLLLLAAPLAAQNIPAGTILPVRLNTGLNATHLRPDQRISARVMQSIPGTPVRRGSRVVGRVVSVTPTRIVLRFDAVVVHGRRIPVTTNLRAIGSMLEVDEAYIPENAPARGMTPENWNTQQIGGDEVYRAGGHVMRGDTVVGEPAAYGVRDRPTPNGPCRGAIDGNHRPQSLWIFSSDACGVYGVSGLTIRHAGRTNPIGTIDLFSRNGSINIRSGSGLLLRVQGS